MFELKKCSYPGCPAYSFMGTDLCYHHTADKQRIHRLITEKLSEESEFRDIYVVAADFRGITVRKGSRLSGSNFSFCVFEDCTFTGVSIIESFFDYCIFRRCSFISDDIRYSVFAGSVFIDCTINDSTVIHNSFMGIDAAGSDFSGNDFYFSNFSFAKIVDTSMEDCNLKRTNFRATIAKNVSFRYSNPEEAFFRREEGYTI